jgi:hypothetical protein
MQHSQASRCTVYLPSFAIAFKQSKAYRSAVACAGGFVAVLRLRGGPEATGPAGAEKVSVPAHVCHNQVRPPALLALWVKSLKTVARLI